MQQKPDDIMTSITQQPKKNHFIWLTLSLVVSMLASALKDEFPHVISLSVIEFANIFLLLVALLSLRKDGSWLKGLLIMIVSMFLLVIIKQQTNAPYLDTAYLLFLLVFYMSAIWLVGRQVLLTGTVNFNKMVGSIALYFLLGLFFSVIYTIMLQYSPDALTGITLQSARENLAETNYFSFVTLTTLGYGDISPVTPTARALVIIEAVTGMFYLAMIVASLVGSMRLRAQ
jgi:voltage-gated potassium channel